jgi:hypothetical protein
VLLRQKCDQFADELIARDGLMIDEAGRERLLAAIARAFQRAAETLKQAGLGNIELSRRLSRDANMEPSRSRQPALPLSNLLERWANEVGPSPKTVYSWKRAISELVAFTGIDDTRNHESGRQVKNDLIARGLTQQTARSARYGLRHSGELST